MPNTFRTSTTAGATSTREHVERSEGQTVVHKWEVTYTCTTGDQAPPPLRPIIVLSQPGGQDAHPTMRMPMERADVPRGRRPHPRPRPHPSPSASSSRHPAPRGAATRASSVVSYATSSRSPIDDPPDCCDPGPSSRRRSPRRAPRDRDCDPSRRYSASPPRRDGDRSRPAIRINKMPSWKPSLNARKIRGTDFSTEWTESHGEGPVDTPPALLLKHALDPRERHRIPVGRLHVHIHNGGVQAWMYVARRPRARARRDDPEAGPGPSRRRAQDDSMGGTRREGERERELGWRPAHKGTRHPRLRGYVLHFLDRGEPGFVRAATVKSYDAGRRKRQRIAQKT